VLVSLYGVKELCYPNKQWEQRGFPQVLCFRISKFDRVAMLRKQVQSYGWEPWGMTPAEASCRVMFLGNNPRPGSPFAHVRVFSRTPDCPSPIPSTVAEHDTRLPSRGLSQSFAIAR